MFSTNKKRQLLIGILFSLLSILAIGLLIDLKEVFALLHEANLRDIGLGLLALYLVRYPLTRFALEKLVKPKESK